MTKLEAIATLAEPTNLVTEAMMYVLLFGALLYLSTYGPIYAQMIYRRTRRKVTRAVNMRRGVVR